MSKQWFHYDGPNFDEDEQAPAAAQLAAHEKTALDAIKAIADYGEAHPDTGLIVGATLRKLSTVAGSRAQSLGLRSVTVKRGQS